MQEMEEFGHCTEPDTFQGNVLNWQKAQWTKYQVCEIELKWELLQN